jgi:hypothetical protein
LLDHFNPLVGVTGDRAMDQFSRHFLFFDQNRCRGFEGRRPELLAAASAETQENIRYKKMTVRRRLNIAR